MKSYQPYLYGLSLWLTGQRTRAGGYHSYQPGSGPESTCCPLGGEGETIVWWGFILSDKIKSGLKLVYIVCQTNVLAFFATRISRFHKMKTRA